MINNYHLRKKSIKISDYKITIDISQDSVFGSLLIRSVWQCQMLKDVHQIQSRLISIVCNLSDTSLPLTNGILHFKSVLNDKGNFSELKSKNTVIKIKKRWLLQRSWNLKLKKIFSNHILFHVLPANKAVNVD